MQLQPAHDEYNLVADALARQVHRDAYSVAAAIVVLATTIAILLAVVNPIR